MSLERVEQSLVTSEILDQKSCELSAAPETTFSEDYCPPPPLVSSSGHVFGNDGLTIRDGESVTSSASPLHVSSGPQSSGGSQHGGSSISSPSRPGSSCQLVLTRINKIRRPHACVVSSVKRASRGDCDETKLAEARRIQERIVMLLQEAKVPLNAEALLEGLWAMWYRANGQQPAIKSKTVTPVVTAGHKRSRGGTREEARDEGEDGLRFRLTEDDVVEHLAELRAQGQVKSFKGNTFHHAASIPRALIIVNLLVSPEYQRLGLEAWTVGGSSFHIVPPQFEHRFLCFRNSSIPGANLGLFLRPHRMLRAGTIVCEYKGRAMRRITHQSSHAVRLQSGLILDGIDSDGNLISFAPLMNDNGPSAFNVKLTEFDEFPERVFVAATRDLFGGEELFVEYGAGYWGKKSYAEVPLAVKIVSSSAGASRGRGGRSTKCAPSGASVSLLHPFPEERNCSKCRDCSSFVPKRVLALHTLGCQDPMVMYVPRVLDPLPYNHFTSAAHSHPNQQLRKSTVVNNIGQTTSAPSSLSVSFVHSTPLTFSLTHEIYNPTELEVLRR